MRKRTTQRPDAAGSERIASQLLVLAFRQHPASLFVNLAASLGVAVMVSGPECPWAWAWFGAVVAVSSGRLCLHLAFVRRGGTQADGEVRARQRWQRTLEGGLLLAGVLWAALSAAGLDDPSREGEFVILIVVSALAGGATGVLAPLRGAAQLYIGLLLVPASVHLLVGDDPNPVLATLGGIFLLVMLIGHHNNRVVLVRSLALQEENAGLVASLRSQNERVQLLNASLERRVAERTEALQTMANHDALTGLLNRRGLIHAIEQRLEDTSAGEPALLFLDLDRFKQINDGLGHDVGDVVLRAVAARFEGCLPAHATIGRWGGDEFVVVARATGALEECGAVAAALRRCLAEPIEAEGEPLQVGVSIGIAAHPADGATATALLRAADLAATEVKRTGRGQVRYYHRTLSEIQRRRLELSLGLKEATTEGSLRIAYQPIVDARTGQVAALEALLRWQHPTLGPIGPDEFIPIAEESDRIVELGAWVMRRACLDAMTWDDGPEPPRVAVNVSIRQLLAGGFPAMVAAALDGSGLAPGRLEVEVTESVFDARHSDLALASLRALHDAGVRVHVDDFGAGYSSLSRLHAFPIDAIKIDRTFVGNLDGAGRTIIEGAILIARRFGLEVVAEGVETVEHAETLFGLGVDGLQGFWLGRPELAPRTLPFRPSWTAGRGRWAATA